uniref:Uncharacterized protein n=1 Tax=Plectus sambesii TaxID=2011161 RepID=A0A914XC33_9BILA
MRCIAIHTTVVTGTADDDSGRSHFAHVAAEIRGTREAQTRTQAKREGKRGDRAKRAALRPPDISHIPEYPFPSSARAAGVKNATNPPYEEGEENKFSHAATVHGHATANRRRHHSCTPSYTHNVFSRPTPTRHRHHLSPLADGQLDNSPPVRASISARSNAGPRRRPRGPTVPPRVLPPPIETPSVGAAVWLVNTR